LNQELCLDPEAHPTLLNVKQLIRALEDIAEVEQEKMFGKEKEELKLSNDKPASPESP
jgi:hypothetical protein